MPWLQVGERRWEVNEGVGLLDALRSAGLDVPYSCRSGSCQICQVRCVAGQVDDARPGRLEAARYSEGWRLSCQCRVVGDLQLLVPDPRGEGVPATLIGHDWLSPQVLRLRLQPERPLRYQAGQYLVVWSPGGVGRPYSLASLPGEDAYLELHVQCAGGTFAREAAGWAVGQVIQLGALGGGALHYDPQWQERPLYLLAAGTGLAPLWAVLREALRQGHVGPISVLHLASCPEEHYQLAALDALARQHAQLSVQPLLPADLPGVLARFRLVQRQAIALVCGSRAAVMEFSRQLFLAGVPRAHIYSDEFLTAGEAPA